jgi:F1F0 ATPase subunit 2
VTTVLEAGSLLQAALAGAAFGGIFFVGLWWTVRLGTLAKNPAPWFLVSLLLRMSVVLGGFFYVGGQHWDRLAACVVGFGAARTVVTAASWLSARRHPGRAAEVPHAH